MQIKIRCSAKSNSSLGSYGGEGNFEGQSLLKITIGSALMKLCTQNVKLQQY